MSSPEPNSQRLSVSVGLGIFLFALLVRWAGIGWGLPNEKHLYSLHPDEPILLGYSQQVNPFGGDLDPGFYNYPTLYLSLSRIGTDFVNAYGGGPRPQPQEATASPAISNLEQAFVLRNYHLAGRWISALAGAGMAWVMFAWLRRRFGMALSVIGALLIALAPGLVMHSCFQTVDITASFLALLSLYWAHRAWEESDSPLKAASLAGLFAGLSAGTKYTGILALFALLSLALKPGAAQKFQSLAAAAGIAVLTFLVTTPGCLLNTSKFVQDFSYEMNHTASGHGLVFAGTPSGFFYHWANLAATTGLLTVVMGIVGIGLMVWRAAKQDDPDSSWSWAWGPMAFFLLTYILIGKSEVKFLRYVFPLVPVLVLGLVTLLHQVGKHQKLSWAAPVLGIFAIAGILGGGLQSTLFNVITMSKPDVRERVADALKSEKSIGLVSDPWYYTPTLYFHTAAPRGLPFADRERFRLQQTSPQVLRFVPESPDERIDWDPRLLRELKPNAVVYSSFEFDDIERISRMNLAGYESQIKNYREFMAILTAEYGIDKVHGGGTAPIHDLQYISPQVWVWKRLKASEMTSTSSSTTSPPSEARPSTP